MENRDSSNTGTLVKGGPGAIGGKFAKADSDMIFTDRNDIDRTDAVIECASKHGVR